MSRGEVWLVSLDPTVGGEIQKTRPCVIISPPEMHDRLRTVLAAPMTTANRPAGYRVPIRFQGKSGLILIDQVRALDKGRLIRLLGKIAPATVRAALEILRATFAE